MDPGWLEAIIAMADAIADPRIRQDVVDGYEGDGYVTEAMWASWAWFVLVSAETVIEIESRRIRRQGLSGTYKDGEEL